MNYEANFYSTKLRETLLLKQRLNSRYSMRAFSRDLKMPPSTLNLVLQGKRPIPKKNLESIISILEMSPFEEAIFRESLEGKNSSLDKIEITKEYQNRYIIDESYFKVIAEWEHYGVLTLMETNNFESCPKFISERLEISIKRAKEVIKNLKTSNLISEDDCGTFKLEKGPLRTSEDISSKALKKSHRETVEMSLAKLDHTEVNERDYSSMTLAMDPKKLPEAKNIIREFRKKMASLLQDGDKTEVIQLAIQLYPLTGPK